MWVERLSPGGPAEASREIALKDELLAVRGQSILGMELDAIHNLIWCARVVLAGTTATRK